MRKTWLNALLAFLFAVTSFDVESLASGGEAESHEHAAAGDVAASAAGHQHGDSDDHHESGDDDCHHHVVHCCCGHFQPVAGIRQAHLDLSGMVSRFALASSFITLTPSALEVLHVPIA